VTDRSTAISPPSSAPASPIPSPATTRCEPSSCCTRSTDRMKRVTGSRSTPAANRRGWDVRTRRSQICTAPPSRIEKERFAMRIGHEYLVVDAAVAARTTTARTAQEHFEDLSELLRRFPSSPDTCTSRDEFLRCSLFAPWIHELHGCYRQALDGADRILS